MSRSDTALLMGSNVVSFTAGVGEGIRADVMDCLQYSQLSADKKYDRSRDWKRWIEQYQRVIFNKGCRLTGAIDSNHVTIRHLRDLRYLPFQATGGATSVELQVLLRRSFDLLMDSEHAKTFFNSWFTSGHSESFQVVPCEPNGRGGVNILVCSLQMTTCALRPSFYFWQVLSGDMTVHSNGASFLLTAESYAPYRQSIRDCLAKQARKEIVEL